MAKIIGINIYVADCLNCGRRIEFEKNEIETKEEKVSMNESETKYFAICPNCKNAINMTGVKPEFREI